MADELDLRPCNMQDGPPIPWFLAEIIHRTIYRSDQSLEQVHRRGGFGWSEVAYMASRKHSKREDADACRIEAWQAMTTALNQQEPT